ncbi:MAG: phosphoribosylanthranilate isomerase [Planctomycetaceae bacterium]|nr:phosphoribosylanthranilate isomerase [Planctomycetaceae bacterium]
MQVASEPASRCIRVKVCGLTQVQEAIDCLDAGVHWIGLNFHRLSPRYVELSVARQIVVALPDRSRAVGLFVNRSPSEVSDIALELGLETIQLHGEEPPEDLAALDRFCLIRAFRLGSIADLSAMEDYLARAAVLGRLPDSVLIDARLPGQHGGTGALVPRELLPRIPRHPRLIFAGGLTPENVAQRISQVRPWMVDVASGVESAPGRKDASRVAAFVRAVRTVTAE